MPLNKEKLAKMLKAVKRGSSHRIGEVVEFSKKHKKYAEEIGRQVEKFVTKSGKENMKGALFVMDALCTSDRAHRAKEKEQGKQVSKEALAEEDESTASYVMFRDYFNHVDRLRVLFHYILKAPEEDHGHIHKVLDHWSNSRWLGEECRELITKLSESPQEVFAGTTSSTSAVPVRNDDDGDVINEDDDDGQYVEPITFEIRDVSMDNTEQFGQTSDIFGRVGDDDYDLPEIMQSGGGGSSSALVSGAFDYYDDDEEDDDERRIEQQRLQLEEDKRRLMSEQEADEDQVGEELKVDSVVE